MLRAGRTKPSLILAAYVCVLLTHVAAAQEPATAPQAGPATEQRFPPLVVPEGFKAKLFACDPLIEYPSVIALGPKLGTVFVAHDYLTGLGTEISRRDEIRLVEDTDGDGYADKSTLFADGFNSIQGLAYHAGTVFAMHAPLLTMLRDTDADGSADVRQDLLAGLGLPPEKNSSRLHCANGVVVGHDGWLYLAMGDNGTEVVRPEGDRLVLQEGGILRCRPDGTGLHVFAAGLRNIYDVALDEELNVFVRDNENDGGDYMIRVCHSFHGADHGYPYLYYERPDEALRPLADLGRGSSAGGACYLETAFPPEFRGNLFFCEWGRAVVRYARQRSGSTFAPMQEVEFAAGAANDPYGFKPTDAIVDRDGSLLISDWGDGQRPVRGRGRLYRVTYPGASTATNEALDSAAPDGRALINQLDSPSYYARVAAQEAFEEQGREGTQILQQALQENTIGPLGRMHAMWVLTHNLGSDAVPDLLSLARSDSDPRVRAQAVRALADLCDPVLSSDSKRSGASRDEVARQLAELAANQDQRVFLEIVIALGRLRWPGTADRLRVHAAEPDAALAHAAAQALRRAGNRPAVLSWLDERDKPAIHDIALRALANRADPLIVDGLMERLPSEPDPERRRQYGDALARVYKKPGPWTYWGYRPAPRPANVVAWERTDVIAQALDRALLDPDFDVRAAVLRRMQREQVPVQVATLGRWLREERTAERAQVILDSLAALPADQTRDILEGVIGNHEFDTESRRAALAMWLGGLAEPRQTRLLALARQVEDGPLLVVFLLELRQRPQVDSRQFLIDKLDSADAAVRAAALQACVDLHVSEAAQRIPEFLKDPDTSVRRVAAAAAGIFGVKESLAELASMSADADPEIRRGCLVSRRMLGDPTAVAVAVAGLEHDTTQLAATEYLSEFGTTEQTGPLVAAGLRSRSVDVLSGTIRALAKWEAAEPVDSQRRENIARAAADVQGRSGLLLWWRVLGPLKARDAAALRSAQSAPTISSAAQSVLATGPESRVDLEPAQSAAPGSLWLALCDFSVAEPTRAQFLASSSGAARIFVNGRKVFDGNKEAPFEPDRDRFETELEAGANRVVVQLDATKPATFHVRFRPLSSSADHEKLVQSALQSSGSAEQGRQIFLDAEKSLCAKCHRLRNEEAGGGSGIGPDLAGIGARFSRIHVIESILEPSRTIAPSYESVAVSLTNGRVVSGVRISEDDALLTLGDENGKRHEIRKVDIEERVSQPRSTMPDGLEKRLSEREFLDLLAYLLSEKKLPGTP